ncbi:MAG: 7-carboxy-7-deazaguanine synthase QueE [Bacteroidales bacterium]
MAERLPLVEHFYTIQGEGYHTGKPAYFIRIGGCDVCCNFCDVKPSWNMELHPVVQISDIETLIEATGATDVVITGGEPLLTDLTNLCNALKKKNLRTYLETSGSAPLTGVWDWICLSPKQNKTPLPDFYSYADELKVVIACEEDFEWAEFCRKKVKSSAKLYLQPEWSKHKKITKTIVDYIKAHPHWNLSLQIHKFIHIP